MSPLLCAAVSWTTLLAQTPPNPPAPSPPAPAPAGKIYFESVMKPGAARLVDVRGKQTGSAKISVGPVQKELKPHFEIHYQFVDSMEEPGSNVWKGWRRYVSTEETDDGVIADPEYTGLEADIWVGRDNMIHFETRGDRGVAKHHLKDLMDTAESFGLAVAMPEALAPGEEADVDFTGLAGWCFALVGKATLAKAHLRFDRVDPKLNVALFTGTVHVEEKIDQTAEESALAAPTTGAGAHDGKLELTYDLAGRRVTRIVSKGHGRSECTVRAKVVGTIVAESNIDVTITGAEGDAAAVALKQKPKFRDVPHELEKSGMVLTLPSDYFKNVTEPGAPYDDFVSAREGMKKVVTVRVSSLETPLKMKEAGEEFGKSLREQVHGCLVTEQPTASGLGAGRRFEFTKDGSRSTAHLLPLGENRYVVVTFAGPEAEVVQHAKEWESVLQRLKKLPAKK